MGSLAEQQAATVLPPRRGKVLAIAVTTVATSYDLRQLAFGAAAPEAANSRRLDVFLTLQADGGAVYVHFRPDTGADLDNTATTNVSPAAYVPTAGPPMPAGVATPMRITRSIDQYLVVKTASGTATLYVWPSSDETGGP